MEKRKIVAVTGSRSEYDLLYAVYKKLDEDDRFDFSVIITGAHLSESYGFTARHILDDGFRVRDWVYNLMDTNQKIGRVISIGHQIPALAQSFARERPDIVLVAGDREEAISTTVTGAFMDIPVAHFFGGDIAKDGNIDNAVRYAASKFAHIHFTSLEAHRETLLKLGEDSWRIFVVGNPALDRIVSIPELDPGQLAKRLGMVTLPSAYVVLIQHPIITEFDKQREHIRTTLEAIKDSGFFCFVNYPNSDPGNAEIIRAYKEYEHLFPDQFSVFQNLGRLEYVNLLRRAKCLLGNSSSGLLEAPTLALPAINIGSRQRGRIHADNVLFVENNKEEIAGAIQKATNDRLFLDLVSKRRNPYGEGKTADVVVDILAKLELSNSLIHKNITY